MREDNKIVHGLWIGDSLSKIEKLTINSFIKHGHEFHLWLYDELKNELPENCIVRNANDILPKEKIYRRKYDDPSCGIGKDSVGSPFADWFRYRLLYEYGGWWTDMDITCLKPLDFTQEYVFREHDKIKVIGNLIKVPRGCELMKLTAEKVDSTCNEDTIDWLLPNRILSDYILELNLGRYIQNDITNSDIWPLTRKFIFKNQKLSMDWYAIHWMNEEWRKRGINKNDIKPSTTIGNLMYQYGLGEKPGLLSRLTGF